MEELTKYQGGLQLTPNQVKEQVQLIQLVMEAVMQKDQHYGIIPGCGNKSTLLKSGAEKLCSTFRLAPSYEGEREPLDLGNGHREYILKCTLKHIFTGDTWGEGLGSCSTMERKYRFRTGPLEFTGEIVPKEYWTLRKSNPQKALKLIGGPGHITKKDDSGTWLVAIQGEPVENENPADQYNTVLKMAAKRAQVSATLSALAASDIFTQDVEDMKENGVIGHEEKAKEPVKEPKGKTDSKTWIGLAGSIRDKIIKKSSKEKFLSELGTMGFTSLEEVPEEHQADVLATLTTILNDLIQS